MKLDFFEKKLPVQFYRLKKIYRRIYLKRFKNKTIQELMDYDATLFKETTGITLDWNNLKRYTEKMQYEKMFDDDSRKVVCSDKYLVRSWIGNKVGSEYLIPLINVYDNAYNINFESLPNSFVLKTNCGSGDIIIVKDKSKLTRKEMTAIKAKLDYYMNFDFGCAQCELHYSKIKPKIVAEKYIEYPGEDLPDYKFLCFDGEVKYCWVDMGRYHMHKRNVYDLDWNLQSWNQKNYGNYDKDIPRPKNFEKMIEIASALCEGFSHVRVDLYNIDGTIYFGEMTFTNGSGYEKIYPDSADFMLGNMWNLDIKKRW